VAIVVGDEERSVEVALALRAQGILTQPIRPPTVPAGSARLRVTVNARVGSQDIERMGRAIASAVAA
jgi:8-amino-7-oxononanoate synthase